MKVARIKELLSEYSDNDELMIAWNDKENLLVDDEQTWSKAVEIYEDSEIYGFNDDCRWAIGEAGRR